MKKPENSFETQWKKQFIDQETDPGGEVWDRISAGVANQQVDKYKRRILFYKFVAAASVLFALLIGSFSLYNLYNSQDANIAALESNDLLEETRISNENEIKSELINDSDLLLRAAENSKSETSDNVEAPGSIVEPIMVSDKDSGIADRYYQPNTSADETMTYKKSNGIQLLTSNQFHYPYVFPLEKGHPEVKFNTYLTPTILSFDEVDEEENTDNYKSMWAGVNFSSGTFDPNISYNQNISPVAMGESFNDPSSVISINAAGYDLKDQHNNMLSYKPEESSYESEMSYSYGLNFGYQFSKRFVVLSGLSYIYSNSSASVNTYVEPANTNAKYANHAIVIERASPGIESYSSLSSDIQLKNAYEFITVPVNMGYNIINRKMKWMLSAGVSADFLVKNTIYDSDNFFNPIEYTPGSDSPYNSTYFNAIFGTMLNYTISKHYLISLEPSYRLGISDLTNDNAVFTSRPSSFLVTAGISFVF